MTGKTLNTFAYGECLGFAWDTYGDIARTRRREATEAGLSFVEIKRAPCELLGF